MTRIQTFDEFSKGSSVSMEVNPNTQTDSITEATDKDKVTKISPSEGEVARWRVVLKKGSENIADNAVPQVLSELAKDKNFQTWWNAKTSVKDPSSGSTFMASGSQLIAFSHKVKEVDRNLFGKEVAKYEIGFRIYATMENGKTYVQYDVSKAEPKGSARVGESPAKLVAWSDESLTTLTLQTKKEAGDADVYAEINPAVQQQLAKAATGSVSTASKTGSAATSGAASASGSASTSGTAASSSATGSSTYVGLKLNPTVKNPKVEELQKKIVALNNTASVKIKSVGGVDGKYGKATAAAIGILVGTNKEETEITPEIATKLDVELAKAPAQPATATQTAKPAAPASNKPAQAKPASTQIKTPGGKTLTF